MNAELGVISRILYKHELEDVANRRVKPEMFIDEQNRKIFQYVLDFNTKYGQLPSMENLAIVFEDYKPAYAKEPVNYYIDKLLEAYVRNKGSELLVKHAGKLVSKPMEGLTDIRSELAKLSLDTETSQDGNASHNLEERKELYLKLKATGGAPDGYATPWEPLDKATLGWHKQEFIAIVARPYTGKEQPLDSLLYGPEGAFTMGEAHVGKRIFGSDGQVYNITGVYPQGHKDCYRVTFSDGTYAECGLDHLWAVKHRRKEGYVTLSLRSIMEQGLLDGTHRKWSIPMVEPLQYSGQDVPLDPYVLGCLLADGCFRKNTMFSNSEPDILEKFSSRLPMGSAIGKTYKGKDHSVLNVHKQLEALGLRRKYSHEKFIPNAYLTSSVGVRLHLLQGLFDCDGYISRDGSFEYTTTSEQLASDIQYLVESLGGTARCSIRHTRFTHKGVVKDGKLSYKLVICMPDWVKCFSSIKHSERDCKQGRTQRHRTIVSVDLVGKKDMQCIMVDSPDHLYVTNHCIVTHNTWLLLKIADFMWCDGLKILLFSMEMSKIALMRRLDAIHWRLPYNGLRSGMLTEHMENKYLEQTDLRDMPDFIIVDTQLGISGISAKIDQYKPDVVLIDGMYLMPDDERGDSPNIRTGNISRGLKRLAKQKNLPIIVTTQFNRMAEEVKFEKVTLAQIGFSDSIGQDSDIVLGMFQTQDMRLNNEMLIRPLKVREGEPLDFRLFWDMYNMEFKLIGDRVEDTSVNDDEEDKNAITASAEEVLRW